MKAENPGRLLRGFSLPQGWSLKTAKGQKPVLFTKEGRGFSLDFSGKKALSVSQPIVKAIGFKGRPLSVLDITAGWAQEAFLISRLGCFVTALESNPFVFYFVKESFRREKPELPGRELQIGAISFILDNSLNYLSRLKIEQRPDVIYMDPMFGDEKKSLSKKSLRILKELVGETKKQKELFELALRTAGKRVVVKRHRLQAPLQKKRQCSFKGRSVCYDVFRPKKGESV